MVRRRPKAEKPKDPEVGDMSVDVLNDEGEVEDIKFFPGGIGVGEFTDSCKGKVCRVFRYEGWQLVRETEK